MLWLFVCFLLKPIWNMLKMRLTSLNSQQETPLELGLALGSFSDIINAQSKPDVYLNYLPPSQLSINRIPCQVGTGFGQVSSCPLVHRQVWTNFGHLGNILPWYVVPLNNCCCGCYVTLDLTSTSTIIGSHCFFALLARCFFPGGVYIPEPGGL